MASDSFDFAISDACVCTYLDKSHNNHSNGGEYKCAISSSIHRIVINEVKELLASCDSTSPRLGLVKRKQVSVLGLDTCCSVSSSEHYSDAKVVKNIVNAIGVKNNWMFTLFLPAAFQRDGSGLAQNGTYWSTTTASDIQGYRVRFEGTTWSAKNYRIRSSGSSIRLASR